MACYDDHPNLTTQDRAATPYLPDVQNNFLEIDTCVVVPLHDASRFGLALVRDLNPELVVQDKILIMNTAAIGAIPAADLRLPLANLAGQSAAIQNALDTLFGGF